MVKSTGFNPIKEDKDGVMAKRMIWSTNAINLAIKGLNEGRKLVFNPFYEKNSKLLKGDLVFQRTQEEIDEWLRCKNDIVYFVEKYCKLMTPEGIQHITLRDYQINYLKHLQNNRLSIYLACRQCGKCVTFLQRVDIQVNNEFWSTHGDRIKKYWDDNYYIKDNNCYNLPLFELYNLYDDSIWWNIQYRLYKFLDKYESKQIEKRTTANKLEK